MNVLNVVFSIIYGVVIAALSFYISSRFEESKFRTITTMIAIGGAGLLVNLFSSIVPIAVAMVLAAVVLAFMGYLIFWFAKNGSSAIEVLAFTVMSFLLSLVGKAAAVRCIDTLWPRPIVGLIIAALPTALFIVSVGIYIASALWFRAEMEEIEEFCDDDEDEEYDDEEGGEFNEATCEA
ncbi:hypothetical protein IJ076_00470 [Candidatus Saccharibacteria bacterium]|nr:hypothetical protein [Candidatus Saccharibacteria bacterium]